MYARKALHSISIYEVLTVHMVTILFSSSLSTEYSNKCFKAWMSTLNVDYFEILSLCYLRHCTLKGNVSEAGKNTAG